MPIKHTRPSSKRQPHPPAPEADVSFLSIELLGQEGVTEPPTEFRIFKLGMYESTKGVFKVTPATAKSVMQHAQKYGNDFCVDYGHAAHSFIALDPSLSGKAAGWFKPEARNGEIWATNVRWTPQAKQMLTDREYRYFSPVFRHSEDGEVLELLSVGLTNLPATTGMKPLMASQQQQPEHQPPTTSQEPSMDIAQLVALLSMSANATEADVVAELARRQSMVAELSALTGQREVPGMLGAIKAWKAGSDTVASLTQRITELEKKEKDAELTALLDQGKRDGKVTPAMEPALRSMPVDQLKAFLTALPVFAGKTPATEPTGQGVGGKVTVELSQSELFVAQKMGVKPELLAQAKAQAQGVK